MKGQMTIIGVIMILISLIVLNAMSPIFVSQVANLKNVTENETEAETISVLADLILPLLVIAIIVSIIIFAIPRQ